MHRYDIVFAGAGLAGLSFAVEMLGRPFFERKTLLLIDRDTKQANDRTWCFWATESEPIPPVVQSSWRYCRFAAPGFEAVLDIAPYRYYQVRGIDFYRWAEQELHRFPNAARIAANIHSINPSSGIVVSEVGDFQGEVVLNSAFAPTALFPEDIPTGWRPPISTLPDATARPAAGNIFLLQHFKGWVVHTPEAAFDPEVMTLMDFCIDQCGQTRFVYVLPSSAHRALVEFTVFSPALLTAAEYDAALRDYLKNRLRLSQFHIEEEEFGVIPMTDYPFSPTRIGRTIHIGTAGGFVKASSGYAFKRTLRRARAFADAWEQTGMPQTQPLRSRPVFHGLDRILLRVLYDRNELGATIFANLFRKLPPAMVLRFLDEDSSAWENLRVVGAPPPVPFLKALFHILLGR